MTLEFVQTALWGAGWFVTVALCAGLSFAHWPSIKAQSKGDEPMLFILPIFVVILLGIAWPAALAIIIGWFLWPVMKRLVDVRNKLDAD